MADEAQKTILQEAVVALERQQRAGGTLVVMAGEVLGKQFPVGGGEMTVGRSSACSICLDHGSVSRSHAMVICDEKGVRVRDCSSTNGSFVNDSKVVEAEVQGGDLIRFGGVVLKYLAPNTVESTYHDQLYKLSTLDSLTQLYNRRYFMEALTREIASAHRYGRPVCMVMFDVDLFKRCNDTYGHPAGDDVLRSIGQTLRERARSADVPARTGGEEFTVILPDVPLQGAVQFAENLRQKLESTPVLHQTHTIHFTISVGVVQLGGKDEGPLELIRRADDLLYEAKRRGRNNVVFD